MFEKITEAEINERSMANVSTTPNRPTAFGESKMDAQALKLRFDRLSRYLAGRLNEIFEALDEGTFAQAVYINHEGRKVNLETFITNLLTGDVDDIQIQTIDGIIYLTELGNKVQEMYNGQATGDLAGNITIVDGVTLKKFYEDFLKMENQGQGEPGKSAYDYAVEGGYQGTEEEFAKKLATDYPSKVSQLENDEKYITASGAPVQTVNGKAGNVSLSSADVGARPNTWTPTAYDVGAEPVNTVNTHNASDQAHNDIRIELRNLANKINDLLDSDDENLNELHEIVEYIKNNHTLISNITTSKVSVVDIVNDLVTSLPNKPLSAAQGVALKALIDAITVPTKLSQLENDKGYITGYTESDPTVPEWAKAASKPSYTKSEVGLANVDNVKQYSASNPPPYPVKSVNNKTGNVALTAGDVGARPNTWTPTAAEVGAEKSGNVATHNTNTAAHNDIRLLIEGLSNRINAIFDSEDTDLDELSEIVAYIKSNKDLIDAITTSKVSVSDIIDNLETSDSKKPLSAKQGIVLKALIDAITVPTKLSELDNDKKFITKSEAPVQSVNNKAGNVKLDAEDVGARPNTWMPTASEVGARPDNWMPTATDVGARPDDWMPTAAEVGARPATWMPSYSDVGAEKAGNVNTHNTNGAAHNDIRLLIASLSERINTVLDSDDTTLDELSEIVAYIKANKTLIESVTTSKVNVSDIIDNLETPDPTKPLSAAQGVVIFNYLDLLAQEFGAALETRANKEQGVFFIKGSGTTAGTWLGVCSGIESYYDGLMIAYKVGVAGASTTTLNINGLGAVKVVKNNNTGISTSFAVNSVLFLVYTVDGSTAYWKAHDYDSNTRNSVGDYQKNNTKLYFVGTTTTDDATSTSYATSYTNSKVYVDANNVFNAESGFKGNLTGNADTATKATQDGNGKNIPDTYETKENAAAKYTELEGKIANASGDNVPDYIVAEAERVAKAVQATRTAKSLVFPIMSDPHLYLDSSYHDNSLVSAQYAGMGIKELKKRMHLDFTAYLGDYTYGPAEYSVEQVKNDMTAFKETTDTNGKEIWVQGNHDMNYGASRDRVMTPDEIYSYVGANSDGVKPYADIERGYGYLDFDNQKIRVVYLNTCDTSDYTVTAGQKAVNEGISPTQMKWLADTALNFSDKNDVSEWGIVIVGHHPLHYGIKCFGNAMKILEGYKNGTSGTVSDTINGTSYTTSYDFIALTERAEIICNIHGHNHNLGYSQISSTTWNYEASTTVKEWLWRFCVSNICDDRYNEAATNELSWFRERYGEFDENGDPVYHYKEAGTAKATSFCVVNIDRKNQMIYAYIFGAGIDREMSYYEAPYTNLLEEAGYEENKYISSSGGATSGKTGYNATGFIPIGVGSSATPNGEQVIYLANTEVINGDSSTRVALYDANKAFIALEASNAWVTTNTNNKVKYTLGSDGYVNVIDASGFTYNAKVNIGKTPAFFRLCGKGIDGDSIITVNEPIV